ncbi:pentatricopeptide repeat-containing protein At5g66520-like [Nymphaea colorata]|uniref:DYW domain-containing protein n=1 Tax=Nymphaea colorata TaxID=210225 RepID=A0A5K1GGC0_9MAGN|nr:pentatricopeptide repeat-containing protein At5g66520-like [Nymphaea colorata]
MLLNALNGRLRLKASKKTLSLLEECLLSMRHVYQIHAHIITSGRSSDKFSLSKLIAFSAISPNGDLAYALSLFRLIHHPNIFMWNTMMRGCVEKDRPVLGLSLYKQMVDGGDRPNNYTFSFLLRSVGGIRGLVEGRCVHGQIVKLGWASYDFVRNGLIHAYVVLGLVDDARQVFDESPEKDVVSWTAVVNGYAKAGRIETARVLFDEMPEKNAVSWSAMIASYTQLGLANEALEMFREMQLAGLRPNYAAILSVLCACAQVGALEQGKWIHCYVGRQGMELDCAVGTALIDVYAKCGYIDIAHQVFVQMPEKDVCAWTSMISGCAMHGHGERAIQLFFEMQRNGVRPNEVSFIGVLSACGQVGLVEYGRRCFENMTRVFNITPGIEHYGCMVNLYGRAGMLEDARALVQTMPVKPDAYVLGALLGAAKMHGDVELAEQMARKLGELGIDHGGVHVLLSNMYAAAQRWEDVARVRKGMEQKKVKKTPGCSLIEVDGEVIEFVAGDKSHAFMKEVELLLYGMDKQLKSLGYVVDKSQFILDVDFTY